MSCFFFQAEDGIRDGTVTGVQTCALPISEGGFLLLAVVAGGSRLRRVGFCGCGLLALRPLGFFPHQRSEERRVGKSVDLGGRRIIKKKNTSIELKTETL